MKLNTAELTYINDVLGLSDIVMPKDQGSSVNKPAAFQLYGQLDAKLLILVDSTFNQNHLRLIEKMMAAMKLDSYSIISVHDLAIYQQQDWPQHLTDFTGEWLLFFSPQLILLMGQHLVLGQVIEIDSKKCIWTHDLENLITPSPLQQKLKSEAWSHLKMIMGDLGL